MAAQTLLHCRACSQLQGAYGEAAFKGQPL